MKEKIKKYGETEIEADVKDKIKAREIVQEVIHHGVSQQQIQQIVYLLALELEDRELMLRLTEAVTGVTGTSTESSKKIIV
tara:strand:- start:269 stop:511 length:243 start_codon:yes stop_codon:yes gene_type:complete